MDYLESLQLKFPELASEISTLGELHSKSLWHELTLQLEQFVVLRQLGLDDTLFTLFTQFITPIVKKLNPLAVASLGVTCAKTQKDVKVAREFLAQLGTAVQSGSEQAHIMCRAEDAVLALSAGEVKEAGTILDECQAYLSQHEAEDVEPLVHATCHRCRSAYLKATKDYDGYYHTALLTLVYSDLEQMPLDVQQGWAYDIGIAALLGEKVYNFGELLGNPVIKTLDATNLQWVPALLQSYNKGDLLAYERVAHQYGDKMANVPELVEKAAFLKQKVQLMALLNFLFNLTDSNTVVSFADVAKTTAVEAPQVEFLLMKALALGVIKGVIDQVAQTISVTWVQARVLDREEIAALAAKVAAWSTAVRGTLDIVNATSTQLAVES